VKVVDVNTTETYLMSAGYEIKGMLGQGFAGDSQELK